MKVLDAIEERRATIFIGVPAMYRMLLEAGAEERDLTSHPGLGVGRRRHAARAGGAFKKMGPPGRLPVVGPVGEAIFVEGYGMVEVGGGVAARLSPPLLGLGLGRGARVAAARLPDSGWSTTASEAAGRQVGELLVKGPGVTRATGATPTPPRRASPTTAGCAPATSPAAARSARWCSRAGRRT